MGSRMSDHYCFLSLLTQHYQSSFDAINIEKVLEKTSDKDIKKVVEVRSITIRR